MSSSRGPLPTTVQSTAVRVCGDAFYFRDDVRAVFITAGVPARLYDKYDIPGYSKPKIARAVLSDLREHGESGFALQRKVVEELCRMTKPSPDAPDQRAGKEALAELKREATAVQVLVSPEKARADARRAASERKAAATQARRERIGELRNDFIRLSQLAPSSAAERQTRGYQLERLLADLFRAYDMDYRPPYKIEGEQIDGSFHFRGSHT